MKRNLIIARHPSAEYKYALLGAQAAASGISLHTGDRCFVVAFNPIETDIKLLSEKISSRYDPKNTNIGISGLCYYDTKFFSLIRKLKKSGFLVYLGGPEARANYLGESGKTVYTNRFAGWEKIFEFVVHGDVSSVYPVLDEIESQHRSFRGKVCSNNPQEEKPSVFGVDWANLLRGDKNRELQPFGGIEYAQVLGQEGCPYAAKSKKISIAVPEWMGYSQKSMLLNTSGCSFCGVATDRGCRRRLSLEDIVSQIKNLPEKDGKKVYFEYIDEMPFITLPKIFRLLQEMKIEIDGLRVLTRADWFLSQKNKVIESVSLAQDMGIYITMFCMGLESFDQKSLDGLNKGTTVEQNLRAIEQMRWLKKKYPLGWRYSRKETHTNQGFIAPTIWDTPDSLRHQLRTIKENGLLEDIYLKKLENTLEISHTTALGEMIRRMEDTSDIRFRRCGPLIEWADKCPFFSDMIECLREFNGKEGLKRNNVGKTQNQPEYDIKKGTMIIG